MTITRRTLIKSTMAGLFSVPFNRPVWAQAAPLIPQKELQMIEARSGGRLGFAALDTQDGRRSTWNSGDRFALNSTFKFRLAAAILMRVDDGQETLTRRIPVPAKGLVEWSPLTRANAGHDMTVDQLCAAAVSFSDNTAANLLLDSLGGPKGLTQLMRAAGDGMTRLDRTEPSLNGATTGDPRDTTTPDAMLAAMGDLLTGDLLQTASRQRLAGYLHNSTTGASRLRAGLPGNWTAGDKTGTGNNGAVSNIAILYPPGRAPVLVAAYFQDSHRPQADLDALHAELGRLVSAYVVI